MFMGEYNHSIDSKGRLIIPARFREQLGDSFIVAPGLDGCLFVYTNEDWKVFYEKLEHLPLTNPDARRFTRYFLGGAIQVEADKQGRILLTPNQRERAGLVKDVVLVGVGNRIEIWDDRKWKDNSTYEDMDEIAANMEGLGI